MRGEEFDYLTSMSVKIGGRHGLIKLWEKTAR